MVWIQDPFPNEVEAEWQVAAFTPRRGVRAREAACHLVAARWREQAERGYLDHFFFVSDVGDLPVADWQAIGRADWPPAHDSLAASSTNTPAAGVA